MIGPALLVISTLGGVDKDFRVTYKVKIRGSYSILNIGDVKRDGTFFGSTGYMWPSDGAENPLAIVRGRVILSKIDYYALKLKDSFVYAIGADKSGGVYLSGLNGPYRYETGTIKIAPFKGKFTDWATVDSTSQIDSYRHAHFVGSGQDREPKGMVRWFRIGNGYKVGDEQVQGSLSLLRGLSIMGPTGKVVLFENQMKVLKGLRGMRLLMVGREGWFAIEAANDKDDYVVWIEPKVKRGQKKVVASRRSTRGQAEGR